MCDGDSVWNGGKVLQTDRQTDMIATRHVTVLNATVSR